MITQCSTITKISNYSVMGQGTDESKKIQTHGKYEPDARGNERTIKKIQCKTRAVVLHIPLE